MKLHFLGTSGALASANREHLSLLLDTEEKAILVDCSGTPVYSILQAGCDLDRLSDVILTHAHTDHLYALPSLLHSLWYRRYRYRPDARAVIRLHALEETLLVVEQLIEAFELRKKPSPLMIETVSINPEANEELDIECDGYSLHAFRVKHGTIPAIGLYFDKHDGSRLLYSADSTVCEAIEARLTPETGILIHECGGGMKGNASHAGAEEINELVLGSSVDTVYLVHLPILTQSELDGVVSRVSQGFAGQVVVPNDGDMISFQKAAQNKESHPVGPSRIK